MSFYLFVKKSLFFSKKILRILFQVLFYSLKTIVKLINIKIEGVVTFYIFKKNIITFIFS